MSPRLPPGSPRCRYRPTRRRCRKAACRCRSPAAANRAEEGVVSIDRLRSLPAFVAFVLLLGFGRPTLAAPADDRALVAYGGYLARAGDCIACHTNPGGALFAGGRPMATPFGTLYTSNITPDPETGIGSWTADQFYGVMHTGRFADGGLIYPAMPFGSYTKVTRADCRRDLRLSALGPAGAPAEPAERPPFSVQQPPADPRLAHAVLQGGRVPARPEPSRRSGTAAPISSRGWAIARCATRRSTPSAAARSRRRSRAA